MVIKGIVIEMLTLSIALITLFYIKAHIRTFWSSFTNISSPERAKGVTAKNDVLNYQDQIVPHHERSLRVFSKLKIPNSRWEKAKNQKV